jgi:hypothetical protein
VLSRVEGAPEVAASPAMEADCGRDGETAGVPPARELGDNWWMVEVVGHKPCRYASAWSRAVAPVALGAGPAAE